MFVGGDLTFFLGTGCDDDNIIVMGDLACTDLSGGNDSLYVGGNTTGLIDLGSGDDQMMLEGTNFYDIFAGYGDDTIIINQVGNDVYMGFGDDKLYVGGFENRTEVDGGSGEDTLVLSGDKDSYTFAKGLFYDILVTDKATGNTLEVEDFENIQFGNSSSMALNMAFYDLVNQTPCFTENNPPIILD